MKTITLILLATTLSVNAGTTSPTMIYGEDNRVDTNKHKSALLKQVADSGAALISTDKIRIAGSGAELRGKAIGEIFKLCKGTKFINQPMIAECSGFLVAPDIMATAGHCYQGGTCGNGRWVFNYKVDDARQRNVTVDEGDVYKCKKVIKASYTRTSDFALIQLDRKVVGHVPVKIAKTPAKIGDKVAMVGHPSGLPQKITDSAVVSSTSEYEFRATLDAFQINSGSMVVNETTGEVLGILVRGGTDFKANGEKNCTDLNVQNEVTAGEGEDVSSFTQFVPFFK